MPAVRFVYENTPALHRESVKAIIRHIGLTKRFWFMLWAVPIVMTVTTAMSASNRESLDAFLTAVLPWWIAYPLIFIGLMKWSVNRNARRRLADDATQQGVLERTLDDNGLYLKNAAMTATVSWSALTHSVETPAFFLVFQGRDSAYALPKAVLAPGAVADARALLREKMGDRARLAKAG